MSADATVNPPTPSESKSSRKKKAKGDAVAPAAATPAEATPSNDGHPNGADGHEGLSHLRELQK